MTDPNSPQREVIDESQLKRMMREEGGFLKRNAHQIVTLVLIGVTVVVYLVEVVLNGLNPDISSRVLIDMGAMFPVYIEGPADLYRFVVPMFLHMDLMHLLFNMVALYSVGMTLERILGKGGFLALYFVGGITGALFACDRNLDIVGAVTLGLMTGYGGGVVRDILKLPANDVWVVDGGSYGEVLIPVVEDVIPQIPESGDIAVHIMDGLIEMNDSEVS